MNNTINFENTYRFFDQAPVIIGFVRGDDYVIEFANDALLKVWKVDRSVYTKSLFNVFPELEEQGFRALLDNVRKTGNPFKAFEYPIAFERSGAEEIYYFDFIYQPFYEEGVVSGVISVGHDVTEKVLAKKMAERGEKKWQQIANTLPVIVWTADAKGNVDFFNDLWYNTTGLSREDSLGFGWTKTIHPDDIEHCLEVWNAALANHTFYEVQIRYRRKDGNYIWILARGVPIIENKVVVGWYGTSTDITEHKNLEEQLHETAKGREQEIEQKESLLQNILRHSTNGISVSRMILNEQGAVVDAQTILANDAAVKYIGLPKEDYLSKPASYFDPNIIASPYGQACINTLKSGEPFIMRYFLEFTKRWLELTVSRMDDLHLIHHFTDVTMVREAELKLEKTLEDLKYSNANLEEFAYAASHDLKEPIRKAQFYSNRIRRELNETLTVEQRALFDRLENSQERMRKLIEDLLEYSQAAKGLADREVIDLNEEIQSVLEDLELEVRTKEASIHVHQLPVIEGNRRQIHQLFQNLISNALKYDKPGIHPLITVQSETGVGKNFKSDLPEDVADGPFHLIRVTDNGIGFEQVHADRIFKVFTRLHVQHYKGSGIGLSIVKKVVESHHGFVWAESEPSKGSVFNILLPADGNA